MKGKPAIVQKGQKYGNLILTGVYEFRNKIRYVEVICECGNTFFTQLMNLKNNNTKSCGCKRNYYNSINNTKHGLGTKGIVHPIYRAWNRIKYDCYNKKSKDFYKYGAKGVKMCDEWLSDFMSFYQWAIANGWEKCLSIDRFPNKFGNYEPTNCRWTNYIMQNRNRDYNVNITAFGETKCLQEWFYDIRCHVSASTVRKRIKDGWEVELAISTVSSTVKGRAKRMTHWIHKEKRA